MRAILAIAAVELRRFIADRSNLFFAFIFPLALVAVIGLQFGGTGGAGGRVSLAAPDGDLRAALVQQWEEADLTVELADDQDGMRQAVARGQAQVGVVVTEAAEQAYAAGERVPLEMVSGSQSSSAAVAEVVRAEAESVGVHAAQESLLTDAGLGDGAAAALEQARADVPGPTMTVQEPEDPLAQEFSGLTQFGLGAASQLLLFVFLNTMAASVSLIQARRNGVVRRTIAAPVTTTQTVAGLALGRVAIALFQGFYIMAATSLLFGVRWGNIAVITLIILVFGLIAAGLALLIGVVIDGEGPATGLSVGVGLLLASIGGSMVPLEVFPDTLRKIAHVTPHAWAYDAIAEVQRRGGGVMDILPELGVLAAMAAVVLLLGAFFLRRSLERAM